MRAGERKRAGLKATLVLAVLGLTVVSGARRAEAIDWDGRWWVGARISDYFPADETNGGFRVSTEVFGVRSENDVKPQESFFPSLTIGRGIKRWDGNSTWRRFQLSLELEVARLDTTVGDETGFRDLDGSTRLATVYPQIDFPRTANDELREEDLTYPTFALGDLTMTPIFVNALFHWGSDRADFYAGPGLGLILAEIDESQEYRDFTADNDGIDDVTVDDSPAVNFKLGANMRLTQNGNLFLFFEVQYFTSALFGGNKVEWSGTLRENGENGIFVGQADYDIDDDGFPDLRGIDSDLRIVDPGKVRIDGATAGIGLRYRFGKRAAKAPMDEAAGF